ncbi:DUF4231 domain-containing protein [Streptomyces sp. NBC_01007]|nr:DUF4231 domain-containing protein [Streptomyces sp. NBC_01007]
MATQRSRLTVEQEIIDVDSEVKNQLFWRRIARTLLFAIFPILTAALAAGNLFIDFSKSDVGRDALNTALGIPLALSLLVGIPFWAESRSALNKAQVRLRKLNAELNSLEVGPDNSDSSAFRSYRDGVPALRDTYRRGADRNRSRHNQFQITVIIGSIMTSVATTATAEQGVWSWIAVALSALVSISAGIISYFKFRERSINLQQTADAIDLEIQAFALSIRRYKNLSPQEAAACFAEEIERIKEEQRKKELQLEQPPEVQPNSPSTPTM